MEIETAKGKFKIERHETDPGLNIEIGNDNRTIGQFSPGSVELLKKGLKYVSNDDLRPIMCGIFIDSEKRKVVASDAHRLCFYELNDSINESFILPAVVAEVFNKDESFKISFDGKYLTFEAENFKLVCNEIEGKYPNWSAIVPERFTQEHKIKSADLLEALELAKITGNSVSQLVKFRFTETGLNLSSSDLDFNTSFESVLQLESGSGLITIGFKNDFLQSIIKTERTEFLTIQTTDPSRAALVNGNIILMPMMLEA